MKLPKWMELPSTVPSDERLAELKEQCLDWIRKCDSKAELAEKCLLSESIIFYYIQEKKNPSFMSLMKLCWALGIKV